MEPRSKQPAPAPYDRRDNPQRSLTPRLDRILTGDQRPIRIRRYESCVSWALIVVGNAHLLE